MWNSHLLRYNTSAKVSMEFCTSLHMSDRAEATLDLKEAHKNLSKYQKSLEKVQIRTMGKSTSKIEKAWLR